MVAVAGARARAEENDDWKDCVSSPPPEPILASVERDRVCHDYVASQRLCGRSSLFKQGRRRKVLSDASHKADFLLQITVEVAIDRNLCDEIDLSKVENVDYGPS